MELMPEKNGMVDGMPKTFAVTDAIRIVKRSCSVETQQMQKAFGLCDGQRLLAHVVLHTLQFPPGNDL